MYAYAKASWDIATTLEDVRNDYLASLYGPAAITMHSHQQATRYLFDEEFAYGQTGEDILSNFRIKKFDAANETLNLTRFSQAVSRMRNSLSAAKSATTDRWLLKRIEILDQDAQLMDHIYGIFNEAAGYKADKNDARKDQVRALIVRVGANSVVTKEDIRCNVLQSLRPHVDSVLGADEAAKYDRVAVVPPE
jgi:hypothetical protein